MYSKTNESTGNHWRNARARCICPAHPPLPLQKQKHLRPKLLVLLRTMDTAMVLMTTAKVVKMVMVQREAWAVSTTEGTLQRGRSLW